MEFYDVLCELSEVQLCCDLAEWSAVRVADSEPAVRAALVAAEVLREGSEPDAYERAQLALGELREHIYACCAEEKAAGMKGWRQRRAVIKENSARAALGALQTAIMAELGISDDEELAELTGTAMLGVEAALKRWFWSVDAVGMPGKRSGVRRAAEQRWAWEFLVNWVYGDVGETAQRLICEAAAGYEGEFSDLVCGAVGAVRAV